VYKLHGLCHYSLPIRVSINGLQSKSSWLILLGMWLQVTIQIVRNTPIYCNSIIQQNPRQYNICRYSISNPTVHSHSSVEHHHRDLVQTTDQHMECLYMEPQHCIVDRQTAGEYILHNSCVQLILICVFKPYVTILLCATKFFFCNRFMYHVAFEFSRWKWLRPSRRWCSTTKTCGGSDTVTIYAILTCYLLVN
jgi:hypothetical protein